MKTKWAEASVDVCAKTVLNQLKRDGILLQKGQKKAGADNSPEEETSTMG